MSMLVARPFAALRVTRSVQGDTERVDGALLPDVNTCGSDAPIAVVRSHDVNPGANLDDARCDSLASLVEAGARCRVDRDRTATCCFGHDGIAIHARHSHSLALAMYSWSAS